MGFLKKKAPTGNTWGSELISLPIKLILVVLFATILDRIVPRYYFTLGSYGWLLLGAFVGILTSSAFTALCRRFRN